MHTCTGKGHEFDRNKPIVLESEPVNNSYEKFQN